MYASVRQRKFCLESKLKGLACFVLSHIFAFFFAASMCNHFDLDDDQVKMIDPGVIGTFLPPKRATFNDFF